MTTPSISPSIYIDFPFHLEGWLGLILLLVVLVLGVKASWEPMRAIAGRHWVLLTGLVMLAPILALVLKIQLPIEGLFPMPGYPKAMYVPEIILLCAIPLVFASGFFNTFWAVFIAALTGLVIAFVNTHHFFTVIDYASSALIFSLLARQRYRTTGFQLLRHPAAAALATGLLLAPVIILTTFLASGGSFAPRVDFAITQTWPMMLARTIELLVAGIISEGFYLLKVKDWGRAGYLVPSPFETSLQRKLLMTALPLMIVLALALSLGDWVVAGNVARQMLRNRLENVAAIAGDSLPNFLETGQSQLQSLSTPELLSMDGETLRAALGQKLRGFRFFNQIYLINADGKLVSAYPKNLADQFQFGKEESNALNLVLKGISTVPYLTQPSIDAKSAVFSFAAGISDSTGHVKGMLLARTDLETNPLTQPAIQAIASLKDLQGEGMILDETQTIVYQSAGVGLFSRYGNVPKTGNSAFEEISKIGVRVMSYSKIVPGNQWRVLVSLPAEQAQNQALTIAIPLLLIMAVLATIAIVSVRIGLRQLTTSLNTLSSEASLMTQGKLDQPVQVDSVDEVGQVGRAFEQMRQSLKARLEELNALLKVSQAVSSNLEAGDTLHPVLEAACLRDANCVRMVLPKEVLADLQYDRPLVLGYGSAQDAYSYLDGQVFELMQHQDVMSIPNTNRIRRLAYPAGATQPGALVAVALQHETQYLGALWVAFERPRNFSEEEIRYLGTLANQASLAASNARLFAQAEIGRQRLEAVLVSSPEPVLVIDEKMRLLLLNSAALQVPGLLSNSATGALIQEVINHPQLLDLIVRREGEKMAAREIVFSSGKVYYASVSIVTANNRLVGKVCVMQDITHYKKLDSMKSDFVATVSHDLRSPLTLIRGYATMMQMVGELNDQQKNYVQKIIVGVDNMSHLIVNLLDLGRIEAGVGLQIEKVIAQEVIEHAVSDVQPQAAQKNIRLESEIAGSQSVQIEADQMLLRQALTNLIDNAVKYTPMGGVVKIGLQIRAESVVFQVVDNGIGIAPLDLPHVFEKFFRSGRREAYQQRGTGLGLAIVKSIADRHGGQVWADSQLGKGSTFFMEIPYRYQKPKQILS